MHHAWVRVAGLALIVAGLMLMVASLALGLMDRSSQDYWFVGGSNCGSVLLPAKFFEGEDVGYRDCEALLDGARTDVYTLLGLGVVVGLAGSVLVVVSTRADHRQSHARQDADPASLR